MSEEKKIWDTEPKPVEKEQQPIRVIVDGWENFPMMVLSAFKWILAFLLASIPVVLILGIFSFIFAEIG